MDQNETKIKTASAPLRIISLLLVVAVLGIGTLAFFLTRAAPPKASIGTSGVITEDKHQVRVPIIIDTANQTMNAAEIHLTFDPRQVEVVGVGKEKSLIKLWITDQPSFSNAAGTISFAGGVMNPGFKGKGQVGTVTLRSKDPLSTELRFANGTQILLNDGKGTAVPLELAPIKVTIP